MEKFTKVIKEQEKNVLKEKIKFDYWFGSQNHFENCLEEIIRHNKLVYLFQLKKEKEIEEELQNKKVIDRVLDDNNFIEYKIYDKHFLWAYYSSLKYCISNLTELTRII